MNVIVKYMKKRRTIMLFVSVLLILGIIMGIVIAFNTKNDFIPLLTQYKSNIKGLTFINLISHFSILCFLLISSILAIGIPLFTMTFFIEGLNIGFLITIFSLTFKLNGFLFALLFILFTNILFLIFLFLLFPKCLEICRNVIGRILYKKDNEIFILRLIGLSLVLIFIAFTAEFISFLISSHILNIFHFLIK